MKLIIFDLDGTLANTLDDLLTALNGMLTELSLPLCSKEKLFTFVNNGIYRFIKLALPEDLQEDEALIQQAITIYEKHYAICYADKSHPYKGLPEALHALSEAGLQLAVLSNKQDPFVKNIIAKIYPDGLFAEVHGQSDLPAKPNPQSTLAIAARLGIAPSDCIYCGDSDVDMLTAKNAGMLPLGVSWGYRSADVLYTTGAAYVAKDAEDLLEFIITK